MSAGVRNNTPHLVYNPKDTESLQGSYSRNHDHTGWCIRWIPTVIVFALPFALWTDPFGHTINAGGDVPNIILRYPISFLSHLGAVTSFTSPLGYTQSVSYDSFAILAAICNTIHLNPECVVGGLVLAGSLTGVRNVVYELSDVRMQYRLMLSGTLAGVVFTLAPLTAELYWTNLLPRVYLMAIGPWIVVAIVRYCRTGHPRYILLGAVVTFMGSMAITDVPGSLPMLALCIPLIAISFIKADGLRPLITLRRMASALLVIAWTNGLWIVPWISEVFAGQAQVAYVESSTGIAQSLAGAHALVPYQSVPDALSLQVSRTMLSAFPSPQLEIAKFLTYLWPIGILPGIIGLVGFIASLRPGYISAHMRQWIALIVTGVLSLVNLSLLTLRLPGTLAIYDWLDKTIPGWSITRNFYEVFALPFVLSVALFAALGALALDDAGWHWVGTWGVGAVVCGFTVYGLPLLDGAYFRLPYYPESPSVTRLIPGISDAYRDVTASITKANAGGGVLTLPLTSSSWSYIDSSEGPSRRDVYIGVSPLYFGSGVYDYNGIDAFPAGIRTLLEQDVIDQNVNAVANVLRLLGVHWIVKEDLSEPAPDFMDVMAAPTEASALSFDEKLVHAIRAVKVQVSGQYSLWKVNNVAPLIRSDLNLGVAASHGLTLVAAGSAATGGHTCGQVVRTWSGSFSGTTVIRITETAKSAPCVLILPVAYARNWLAQMNNKRKVIMLRRQVAYGSLMGFVLPKSQLGEKYNVTVHYAAPPIFEYGAGVSIVGLTGLGTIWASDKVRIQRNARLSSTGVGES